MEPFQLTFTLTRRQRLAVELPPWLPAIAATIGFGVGAAYAGLYASRWLLLLLLLPLVMYRGLFVFAFDIVFRGRLAVELIVDAVDLEVRVHGEAKRLPLEGVFQVFRDGDTWTVLHLDGTILTVPVQAISPEQIEYLRTFVRKAAAARAALQG
jgi:hypothetical protein